MNQKGLKSFYFIAGIGCGLYGVLLLWRVLSHLATADTTEIALVFLFFIVTGLATIQFKLVSAQERKK